MRLSAPVILLLGVCAHAQSPPPQRATPDSMMAGGSCEQRPSSGKTSAPTLEVRRLTPAAGARVNAATLVQASVAYDIPAYRDGHYTLSAQFDTMESGVTVDGVFRGGLVVRACGPSGIFSFALPLENVYRYAAIRRPLRFRFYLLMGTGETLEVVAASEDVEFAER